MGIAASSQQDSGRTSVCGRCLRRFRGPSGGGAAESLLADPGDAASNDSLGSEGVRLEQQLDTRPASCESRLSPSELAALLGNTCPDAPSSGEADTEDLHASEGLEGEGGPSGEALLEGLSCEDGATARALVMQAGPLALNVVDDIGRNALLIAAAEGHLDACRALLHRADFRGVNQRNLIGSTALHIAAGNGQADICHCLLDCPRYSLDVNAVNSQGKTPMDFAIEFGEGVAAGVLDAAGGRLSGQEPRGCVRGRHAANQADGTCLRERRHGDGSDLGIVSALMTELD